MPNSSLNNSTLSIANISVLFLQGEEKKDKKKERIKISLLLSLKKKRLDFCNTTTKLHFHVIFYGPSHHFFKRRLY